MKNKVEVLDSKKAEKEPSTDAERFRRKLGELKDLDEDQLSRLKKFLHKRITDWETNTAELRQRLEEDNDLVEGVIEDTDYPWTGCSNVHVDITGIYMRVFHSTFKRSILGADMLWSADLDAETYMAEGEQSQLQMKANAAASPAAPQGQVQAGGPGPVPAGQPQQDTRVDLAAKVEDLMNDKAFHEWNIAKRLKGVLWTTCRDGLGVMQITWSEEYEPSADTMLLTGVEDFDAEFPTPEAAGMDEKEYQSLRETVQSEATVDEPYEVDFNFEKRTYYGNKGEIVELADFVTFPASAPSISRADCQGYGKRFTMAKWDIKRRMKGGVFYEEATEAVLKKRGSSTAKPYTTSKDQIEGISRSGNKDIELFEVVIWFRLDKEGEDQKLLVTYSKEANAVLSVMDYPYRVDFYALFRIEERPNRMSGPGIPPRTRDMNDEIDTQHNQRINSRTISTVPSFKADNSLKQGENAFDPNREENRFRPGVVFWLSNPDKFEQFKVQPTDMGESMQEEENDMRILDLALGASVALMSGQLPGKDAGMPGNKTGMLINQSNLRLDDPLDALREGVEQVGLICLSHLYQFGPPQIPYMVDGPNGPKVQTLHKKVLRKGVLLRMKAVTVADNPDAEMAKRYQVHQMLMAEPTFAQDADRRVESLREVMRRGRITDRNRILPPPETIKAQQVELQKQAMQKMAVEQAAAKQKQADDAVKGRIAKIQQDKQIQSLAAGQAKEGLSLPVPAQGGTSGAA